ncbi:MAG TPA: DUF1801 domain-containing protein [Bryobacteraceae bacterium]
MAARVPPPAPEYLEFLSPYPAGVVELALATRSLVLEEAPGSIELLYDAYNAVAAGYSFTGRPSEAFIHIAVYAKWVNLGFHRGSELDDPHSLLQGSGRWVRHIRIAEPRHLDQPHIRAFVRAAIARAKRPGPQVAKSPDPGQSAVRAIYPKRRRPSPKT